MVGPGTERTLIQVGLCRGHSGISLFTAGAVTGGGACALGCDVGVRFRETFLLETPACLPELSQACVRFLGPS